MRKINDRIKNYRNQLHLSQKYIANYLGIELEAVEDIECGRRTVSSGEISLLSVLFNISPNILMNDDTISSTPILGRNYDSLNSKDQDEIISLTKFKKMVKAQRDK